MFNDKHYSTIPIGYVITQTKDTKIRDKNIISQIMIFNEFIEALKGIEEFSHIYVLFWLDKISTKDRPLKVHPRGRKDLPLVGVFATRSMFRPNPIGLTIVKIIDVKKNMIIVRGLDAFNLSPVLDIKPYDFWDKNKEIIVPEWWQILEKEKTSKYGKNNSDDTQRG